MKRITLTMVVAAALALNACATTKTSTKVQRAPWLSFKGAKTVAIDAQWKCVDVWRGPNAAPPETVEAEKVDLGIGTLSFGASISTGKLAERRVSCDGSDFLATVRETTMMLLQRHLATQGFTVVEGPADRVLAAAIQVERVRQVEKWSDREDTPPKGKDKGDQTCASLCGSSECGNYGANGAVVLQSMWIAPALDLGLEQVVDRNYTFDSLDDMGFVACSHADAAQKYEDDRVFQLDAGRRSMLEWLDFTFRYMYGRYEEEYDVILFDTDETKEAERGVELAKEHQWARAYEYFTVAMAEIEEKMVDDDELRAQICYNAAAAAMNTGELEKALELAERSHQIFPQSEAADLVKEVERRIMDRHKLH